MTTPTPPRPTPPPLPWPSPFPQPRTRHPSTRGTVYLCAVQAVTLAGLLLVLAGLPTDQPDDGPDLRWRDATQAERAAHAVEQARDLKAALAQAQQNGAPAAPPAGAPTTTHKGSDHQ